MEGGTPRLALYRSIGFSRRRDDSRCRRSRLVSRRLDSVVEAAAKVSPGPGGISGENVADQAELAGVVRRQFGREFIEVVVPGIEFADELVQLERGLPDFKQETAARATAVSRRAAIGGGIVALVAPATAVELARSDLQRLALRPFHFSGFAYAGGYLITCRPKLHAHCNPGRQKLVSRM